MKQTLTFLIYGDIFGSLGRAIVIEKNRSLKKKYKADLVIANAENLTHGSGTSPATIKELRDAGVDFFTGGNHSFDNDKASQMFDDPVMPVIRPANWPGMPGVGHKIVEIGDHKVLIINLIGTLFMKPGFGNPFTEIDKILEAEKSQKFAATIVDIHAEATSEKISMAYYLDGKVSLVFGSHTHVPTCDQRILPKGTGFISDIGMNGPLDSIIGMKVESVISRFRFPEERFKVQIEETGGKILNALVVTVDVRTGKCVKITRVQETYNT